MEREISELKISIIIPCYNEENFLERCLNTVINQTIDSFEIILVDDGSYDNTPNICDEYKNRFPHLIKVIHQSNSGQGYARNAGLKIAQGEYVGFVDADDWIDPTMYEKLYTNAKYYNSDITFCDIKKIIVDDGYEVNELSMPFKEGLIDIGAYLKDGLNNAYSMNRIYKRKLWDKYKYKKMVYEDLELLFTLQSNCERISYVQEFLCTYFKHPGSTTTSFNDVKLLDMIYAYRNAIYNCNTKYKDEVVFNMSSRLLRYLKTKGLEVYRAEFIELINELMPYFELNNYILNNEYNSKILSYKNYDTIPNNIYYANFENGENLNLDNWKKYTRDANIVELNENTCNFDLAPNTIKEAYFEHNYDLVNKYFLLQHLFYNGGIAIDKDIKLTKPLGELRTYENFFIGREFKMFGLRKGNLLASKLLKNINENRSLVYETIIENKEIKDIINFLPMEEN